MSITNNEYLTKLYQSNEIELAELNCKHRIELAIYNSKHDALQSQNKSISQQIKNIDDSDQTVLLESNTELYSSQTVRNATNQKEDNNEKI